jgi:hypothetical protein
LTKGQRRKIWHATSAQANSFRNARQAIENKGKEFLARMLRMDWNGGSHATTPLSCFQGDPA